MPLWARKGADLNSMAEESKHIKKYHKQWCEDNGYKLGQMISKVKSETKWRDIFVIDRDVVDETKKQRK